MKKYYYYNMNPLPVFPAFLCASERWFRFKSHQRLSVIFKAQLTQLVYSLKTLRECTIIHQNLAFRCSRNLHKKMLVWLFTRVAEDCYNPKSWKRNVFLRRYRPFIAQCVVDGERFDRPRSLLMALRSGR